MARFYIYVPIKGGYLWDNRGKVDFSKEPVSGYAGNKLYKYTQWLNDKTFRYELKDCPYDITYSDFFNTYLWKGDIIQQNPFGHLHGTLKAIKTGILDVEIKLKSITLQRKYMWDEDRASKFLKHFLIHGTQGIGTISITSKNTDSDINKDQYYLLDGKQRLLTIQKFLDNEIPVLHNGKLYLQDKIHPTLISNAFSGPSTIDLYGGYSHSILNDNELIQLFALLNYQHMSQIPSKTKKILKMIDGNYINENTNY